MTECVGMCVCTGPACEIRVVSLCTCDIRGVCVCVKQLHTGATKAILKLCISLVQKKWQGRGQAWALRFPGTGPCWHEDKLRPAEQQGIQVGGGYLAAVQCLESERCASVFTKVGLGWMLLPAFCPSMSES
jgi:hypothetical protein